MASAPIAPITDGERRRLIVQREVTRLLSPLAFPLVLLALRFGLGYRIEGHRALRRSYRRVCSEIDGPMMICANHLTMIDSFVIAWAIGSPWWYLTHFRTLPWNVPEQANFAATLPLRILIYALKCLPIQRGGQRKQVSGVLSKLAHLIANGETVLIFPEAGRSRTGRVQVESAATGVGRIYRSLSRCSVVCVYLRGECQDSFSGIPARRDRFRGAISVVEPKTDQRGVRASRDIAQQILARLADMEREHFDARQ